MNSALITAAAALAGMVETAETDCVPLNLQIAVGRISSALTALAYEPAQPDATMTFIASLQERIDHLEALVTLQAPAPQAQAPEQAAAPLHPLM